MTTSQTPGFREAFPGIGDAATVLDGLEALQGSVGQHLGWGPWHEITQEQVDRFAEATWDHQWIHVRPDLAAQGPFGAPIAHGFLTLSLASYLMAEVVEVRGAGLVVNYGANKVRFPAPVRVGSRIRGGGEFASLEDVGGGWTQAVFRLTVEVEDGSKPACVAETVFRFSF